MNLFSINKSIEIISEITNYTTIVLGSNAKDNKLKKVEVIPLEETKILTMVITDKGVVEHKNLYLPKEISITEVTKTVELINKLIVGTPINEVSEKLEYEIKFYESKTAVTKLTKDIKAVKRVSSLHLSVVVYL